MGRNGWRLIDGGTVHGQKEGATFLAINRIDTKAGAAHKSATLFHALTEQGRKVTDLGAGPAEASIAAAVNDLGTAVGTKGPPGSPATDAVVWQGGAQQVLDDRGGSGRAEDSNGTIVVGSIRIQGATASTAAAWGSGPLVLLQDRIPPGLGVDTGERERDQRQRRDRRHRVLHGPDARLPADAGGITLRV